MSPKRAMRCIIFALLGLSALGGAGRVAEAAELLMFRRAGCPWCAHWDREIGPIYPKTEIGRRAPLRMIDLDRDGGGPNVRIRSRVIYTPTFILVEAGQEIGRIEGYPGDAFFWGLLEQIFNKLGKPDKQSGPMPSFKLAA
jgi:hypothetical protein